MPTIRINDIERYNPEHTPSNRSKKPNKNQDETFFKRIKNDKNRRPSNYKSK